MLKPITLKVEEQQIKLLDKVSKATHIPKSALIRKGIDLVLRQAREGALVPSIKKEIDSLLAEDHELLKRLAD